jgi:hypothetical protein
VRFRKFLTDLANYISSTVCQGTSSAPGPKKSSRCLLKMNRHMFARTWRGVPRNSPNWFKCMSKKRRRPRLWHCFGRQHSGLTQQLVSSNSKWSKRDSDKVQDYRGYGLVTSRSNVIRTPIGPEIQNHQFRVFGLVKYSKKWFTSQLLFSRIIKSSFSENNEKCI